MTIYSITETPQQVILRGGIIMYEEQLAPATQIPMPRKALPKIELSKMRWVPPKKEPLPKIELSKMRWKKPAVQRVPTTPTYTEPATPVYQEPALIQQTYPEQLPTYSPLYEPTTQRREQCTYGNTTTDKVTNAMGRIAKTVAKNAITKILTVTLLAGTPLQHKTHVLEKAVGLACTILPHKELGRFWEGVHMYEAQAGALQQEESLLDFLPVVPDFGPLPDVSIIEQYPLSKDNAVTFRTADGEIFYEKAATQIHLEEIPDNIKRAITLREDAEFYNHAGINWKGIGRAAIFLGKRGGGSSIDMQVAKQIAVEQESSPEHSLTRKVTDILSAVELNARYDKDTILNFYANYMYFGNGNYGIETAAQDYFGKPAEELAFNEAVFLACLLNDPGNNPKTKDGFAVQWNDYKREIAKLARDGEITEKEAKKYTQRSAIKIEGKKKKKETGKSMYASTVQTVYTYALQDTHNINIRPAIDGGERFYSVDIITTVGPITTTAAYNALQNSSVPEHAEVSMVILDEQQRIKAIIGTKEDYSIAEAGALPNTAIERRRPMGSTFKPLVFTYAEEKGVIDMDDVFDESTKYTDKDGYATPRNWDNTYDRTFTPSGALLNSNNRVAVHVYDDVRSSLFGLRWNSFTDYLETTGLETTTQFQDNNDYTYALGTQSATGLELAQAYNNLFNEATTCKPWIIESISIGETTIDYGCNKEPAKDASPFYETLETIAARNGVTNEHGTVGLKTGTTNGALVTRVAGFYHRKGVNYSFVIDVDGQGESVGGSASKVVAPIAREYFNNLN
jgi:membrane peptidoglycan carboxypeptidase